MDGPLDNTDTQTYANYRCRDWFISLYRFLLRFLYGFLHRFPFKIPYDSYTESFRDVLTRILKTSLLGSFAEIIRY